MKKNTKKIARGIFIRYTAAILCLISILTISLLHLSYIDKNLKDITETYITQITAQSVELAERQINSDIRTIELLAKLVGGPGLVDIDKFGDIIIRETTVKGYSTIGIISPEGNYIFSSNSVISGVDYSFNIADRDYFKKAMAGEINLSDTIVSRATNEKVNVYGAPIYQNNQIIGVMSVSINNQDFSQGIFLEAFNGKAFSYIIDTNGKIIFKSDYSKKDLTYENTFNDYFTYITQEKNNEYQILRDMASRKGGIIELEHGKGIIYACYQPLEINKWYYVFVVPENVVKTQIPNTDYELIYLVIIVIAAISFYRYIRKVNLKQMENQVKEQTINETSYKIIMDQTNEILFEYNTIKKTYIYSANFKKTFGYEPSQKGLINSLRNNYIYHDDIGKIIGLYKKMIDKKTLVKSEIRILNADGQPIWTQVQMTGVYDNDSKLVRVIGKILDIDEQKKAIEILKEKAVLDSGTGLYNKATTEDLIKEFLQNEGKNGKHALLIIDIDDFKEINDDHGHRKGDMIIAEIGAEISKVFRTSDIIGRIGGDEFMVLIKNIEDLAFIKQKAQLICNIFNLKEFESGKAVRISTSIGIAIYNKDGETYEELYEAADQALYTCKGVEKGTYAFYDRKQIKFNKTEETKITE